MSRVELRALATRDSFLESIYHAGLVSFGPEMRVWADKWFQHETFLRWNPRAEEFLPRTFLLRDCPPSHLAEWLESEFPSGFVAKPAVGHSSEGLGLITHGNTLVARWSELALQNWIVQQRAGSGFGPGMPEEFRVHTFWHRVVPEATFSRWDVLWDDDLFIEIEETAQRFLDLFPAESLRGHAWGLDVIRLAPGNIRIIDLNTNRGEPRKWSGDLAAPDVLGAYARHLERNHNVEFLGDDGMRLRENLADPRKWIKKAGEASVRKHEELRQRSWRLKRYRGFQSSAW